MEDSYETERISVKYISESNVVVIAFKAEEVLSEEYRTSTMLAVDLLGQHKNSILKIEMIEFTQLLVICMKAAKGIFMVHHYDQQDTAGKCNRHANDIDCCMQFIFLHIPEKHF